MSETVLVYTYRIFWALFLSFMLIWGFRCSWQAENIKDYSGVREDTAVISLDPALFPMLLALCTFLYLILWREKGAVYLLAMITDICLFICIYFTLLILFLPVLRKHYTARTCVALWLIPMLLYYQPNIMFISAPLPAAAILYIPGEILRICFSVWIAGFGIILAVQIILHILFASELERNSYPVEVPELLAKWESVRKEMNCRPSSRLRYSPALTTPLTVGLRKKKRVTYLPEREYTEEELKLIFSHELYHVQRNDTHTKFFLKFCNALGWVNPLVWAAVKKAEADLELACDEIVLKNADGTERRRYAELLLSTAGEPRGYTTCLSASAKTLRYRLRETQTARKRRAGFILLFTVMFVSSLAVGKIAIATERGSLGEITGLDLMDLTEASAGFGRDGEESCEIRDVKRLSSYLSGLQMETVLSSYGTGNSPLEGENTLYGKMGTAGGTFYIHDDYLEIYDSGYAGQTVQYHFVEPLDWEYVRALCETEG